MKKTEYLGALQQYLIDAGLHVNGTYRGPKIISSDRDSVVCSSKSREYYRLIGTEIQTSAPHVHAQNYVEQAWRVLKHKLQATMQFVQAPSKFWGHALRHTAAAQRVTMGSTADKFHQFQIYEIFW